MALGCYATVAKLKHTGKDRPMLVRIISSSGNVALGSTNPVPLVFASVYFKFATVAKQPSATFPGLDMISTSTGLSFRVCFSFATVTKAPKRILTLSFLGGSMRQDGF